MKPKKKHKFVIWVDTHLVFLFDAARDVEDLRDFEFKSPPSKKQKKLMGRFLGVSIEDDCDLQVTVEIDPSLPHDQTLIGKGILALPTGELTVGTGGPNDERTRRVWVPAGDYSVEVRRSYIDHLQVALSSVDSLAEVEAVDNWICPK